VNGDHGEPATSDLELRFDTAMMDIYERAGREVAYWATRYLQMLRRRGGLGTARQLLQARFTSDGYARLRDAGRLDLTVEALVLNPEFESLFSEAELAQARDRLRRYRELPTTAQLEPSPELMALVMQAAAASDGLRIGLRDRIAAFGAPAIVAMQRWVDEQRSPGFAVAVIEAVGRAVDPDRSLAVLRGFRARFPDWITFIDGAIVRVDQARRQRGT
jgi:hypothetical protein